jgi:hypothetical protein
MSDRLRAATDDELGAALAAVRDELAWPVTPEAARAVGDAIADQLATSSLVAPRLSLPSRRRTLLVIAAALLALAGAALAARLVIELGAVAVQVLPGRPTNLPTSVASGPDLGREVSLEEAAAAAGFRPALPVALGAPRRTWVDEADVSPEPGGRAVRIVTEWRPSADLPEIPRTGAGALLMQFQGGWEAAAKLLHAETNHFGGAIVDGRDAFWTSGEHELRLVSGDRTRRLLVTGNVLIWEEAGFTFRLETALPRDRAIEIAESLPR